MFDIRVVKAFRTAVEKEENWTNNGVNWDFVDADMYMECTPKNKKQVAQFYRIFDELAKFFVAEWSDVTQYDDYIAAKAKIDAEYAELFGVA